MEGGRRSSHTLSHFLQIPIEHDADGGSVDGMTIPPDVAYLDRIKDIKATRELITRRMRLGLDLCPFSTPFVSACFVGVMTSSHVNCKSSWYLTVTSASLAIPCILGLLVLTVQISTLMDKYDGFWDDFEQLENSAVSTDPNLYEKIEYSLWLSCCLVQLPKWRRNLIIYLTLVAYIFTVMLVLAGPYLFLCGAFSVPRKSP